MDAHSFRILGSALIELLERARIDKIYGPFPNVTLFQCFGKGTNFRFALRADRQNPSVFIMSANTKNPARPSAPIMRLRKYLIGLHFGRGVLNLESRTLAFPIVRRGETLRWLFLDPRDGIIFKDDLDEDFDKPSLWPDKETIISLSNKEFIRKEDAKAWLKFPLLTPLLRETLASLEEAEALALMVDLEMGGDNLFYYRNENEEMASFYSAWPLPSKLLKEKRIKEIDGKENEKDSIISNALYNSSLIDERLLLDDFSKRKTTKTKRPERRRIRRLKRNIKNVKNDEKRLKEMIERQKDALLIQDHLWQLNPQEKTDKVLISKLLASGENKEYVLKLNKNLTIIDNMKRIFDRASKGKRGLRHTARRIRQLENELAILSSERQSPKKDNISDENGTSRARPNKSQSKSIRGIASYTSKDGYTILRGKSAQGNHKLLRIGHPHDYWLHSSDGPSAHALIRRDHDKDEVPESTLHEAARLVAEKSWQRHDSKADVMLALLRQVRTIKGAPAGTVRVDDILQNIHISLE